MKKAMQEVFSYDPRSGFFWTNGDTTKQIVEGPLTIDDKQYSLATCAYAYMTGKLFNYFEYKDKNPENLAFENLSPVEQPKWNGLSRRF